MDVTAFTGRERELQVLDRILDTSLNGPSFANAVISGPGGVGKTGLAVHWAHRVRDRFTDGELYIDLHGYSPERPLDPMDALAQLLDSFGLSDNELPQRLSERAARYRSLIYGRRMLLVLDNASSNEQIRELLPGSATCAVVITSRDRLDSFTARYGGVSLSLDVLRREDSVNLLGGLIGGRVGDDRAASEEMAESCGHHALALRIAATIAITRPDASISALVEDLRRGRSELDSLAIGDDPHTDLRAVFSWSLRNLSAEVRRAFVLIGLFPINVLDLFGLAALWGTTMDEARELSEVLIRAHLLSRAQGSRYAMHDLLRSYAHELAEEELASTERGSAVERLLDFHAAAASRAMDVFHPMEQALRPDPPQFAGPVPEFGSQEAALSWLNAERVNLLAAALWAADHDQFHHTSRMAFTIFRYLDMCGNLYHNERLQSAAIRVPHPVQRGRAFEYLSVVQVRTARYEQAIEGSRQAIQLAREAGDIALEAACLANLGAYYSWTGRFEDGLECLERALRLILKTGLASEIARIRNLTGKALLELGRYEEAEEQLTIALDMYRAGESPYFEAVVNYRFGLLRLRSGDPGAALKSFEFSRQVFTAMNNRSQVPGVINDIANAHRDQEEFELATERHFEALSMAREFAVLDSELIILNDLALTLRADGRLEEALQHHQLALGLARQSGHPLVLQRAKDGLNALAAEVSSDR
ncbi:ATP-binding protein [Glycomyces terrestris]|nr:tetratricopeptide repeat protein [Glycomyces terrestris]